MTPRCKLRTLLIVLAVLPPLLWLGWTKYEAWRAEQARRTIRVPPGPKSIAFDFTFPTTPTTPAESDQEFSFFFGVTRQMPTHAPLQTPRASDCRANKSPSESAGAG